MLVSPARAGVKRAIILVVGGLALGSCDEGLLGPTEVRDVTWKLESIERAGAPTILVPNPERYTLRLEADGRLSVRADCNSCVGTYALSGTSLSIGLLACTRAFCGDSSLDTAYTGALGNAQTAVAAPNQLVIKGNGFTLRFRN